VQIALSAGDCMHGRFNMCRLSSSVLSMTCISYGHDTVNRWGQ